MDRRERWEDPEEALRAAMAGLRADLWTALPATILSFDPAAMTVSVQPAVTRLLRRQDGTTEHVALPALADLPVQFPGGGGASLTFPAAAGDECLVVFASRCIDAWWQSSGVQQPARPRTHSLSDGFALLGFRSRPRALSGVSTTATQLRSDDGSTVVELAPGSHAVTITAPGGLIINGDVTVNGKVDTTGDVKAGTVSLQHHVHTNTQPGGGLSGIPQA